MKKALGITLGLGTLFSFALPAFAQGVVTCPAGQFAGLCTLNANSIGPLVSTAVTVLLIVAVLISLFFLIWGGIRWITSGGDKAKVAEARSHIIAAIVGLVIAFLAFFILTLVL